MWKRPPPHSPRNTVSAIRTNIISNNSLNLQTAINLRYQFISVGKLLSQLQPSFSPQWKTWYHSTVRYYSFNGASLYPGSSLRRGFATSTQPSDQNEAKATQSSSQRAPSQDTDTPKVNQAMQYIDRLKWMFFSIELEGKVVLISLQTKYMTKTSNQIALSLLISII